MATSVDTVDGERRLLAAHRHTRFQMISAHRAAIDDLLEATPEAAIFKAFCLLPPPDRTKFARWIARAGDEETHQRRSELLALVLGKGPLGAV